MVQKGGNNYMSRRSHTAANAHLNDSISSHMLQPHRHNMQPEGIIRHDDGCLEQEGLIGTLQDCGRLGACGATCSVLDVLSRILRSSQDLTGRAEFCQASTTQAATRRMASPYFETSGHRGVSLRRRSQCAYTMDMHTVYRGPSARKDEHSSSTHHDIIERHSVGYRQRLQL